MLKTLVYNLHGEIASVADLIELIREALPEGKPALTYYAATQVPVVGAFDDRAFQRDLGPLPATPPRDGVRRTVAHFERLLRAGRLDTRELA